MLLVRLMSPQTRINRNILECKVAHTSPKMAKKKVLIETYWNVKGF